MKYAVWWPKLHPYNAMKKNGENREARIVADLAGEWRHSASGIGTSVKQATFDGR